MGSILEMDPIILATCWHYSSGTAIVLKGQISVGTYLLAPMFQRPSIKHRPTVFNAIKG